MTKLMTTKDICDVMNVNPETVYKWFKKGLLKGTRPGGKEWVIRHEDFEDFLNRPKPQKTSTGEYDN